MDKIINNKTEKANESLYDFIANDNKLYEFFLEFNNYGNKIDEIDVQNSLKNFVEIGDKYIKEENECKELIKKLESLDIKLATENKVQVYRVVSKANSTGFGNNGKYDFKFVTFPNLFNGIEISKEMLNGSNVSYIEEYLEWEKQNLENKIKDLSKEIEVKEKKFNRSIFNKKKFSNELKTLRANLEFLNKEMAKGEILKKKKEIFESFTTKQKEIIYKYLFSIDKCKKLSNEIKNSIYEYNEIEMKYNSKRNRKNKWNRAFQMMKEKVNSEFCEIDAILENFVYDGSTSNKSKNNITNEMKGAIDWYYTYCFKSNKKVNIKSR